MATVRHDIPTPVYLDALPAAPLIAPRATDTNVGSARTLQNQSASTVLATLGPTALYALGFLIAFIVLRRLFPRVYYPRSFLGSLRQQERSPKLPGGFFNWFGTFWNTSDYVVLNKHTLDGFLFLRHLKLAVITCVVGMACTWPILLPVNATGAGGQTQLNILTFSNAAGPSDPSSYYRYYAHVFCAYVFFGFILHMITRESIFYINLRQAYLVSPLYANRVSSRTVLFTSTPDEYLKPTIIRKLFGEDVVRNVWIPKHTKSLRDAVDGRNKIAMKLENAEITLIKKANAARLKRLKETSSGGGEELKALRSNSIVQQNTTNDTGFVAEDEGEEKWSKWLEDKDRPTHKLGFMGLFGDKVDTIEWCRKELTKCTPEVEKLQKQHREGKGKAYNAVFVEFETLRDAQSAYQSLTHHESLHMAPRYTGILPGEIIWMNMRIRWFERIVRVVATTAFWIALIVFWTIPVAFISSISSVGFLSGLPGLGWLKFLSNLPGWASGLVTGLLPSILLSILMTLLPPVLRLTAKLSGDPTLSAVEYSIQNSYFWFYLIQVFLVTTLSNGAFKAAEQIYQNPTSVVDLLADALPSSSNFYLSYIIIQGLGVVSNTIIGLVGLLLFVSLGKLLDTTPRAMWNRWTSLSDPGMGTVYPIYTTMFVIAISYSCIAPLVIGFAAIGLFCFYLAYRYEFLYVYNVPYDTKGLMYARALQQLFVGLYLAELCLIGLFSIGAGQSKIVIGPLALMIIFLIFTILCHVSLNTALDPLLRYLPKTLETEEQRLLAMEIEDEATEKEGRDSTSQLNRTLVDRPPVDGNNSDDDATAYHAITDRLEAALPGLAHYNKRHAHKKENPNFILKWFRPSIYSDYYTLRKLVPRDFARIEYDDAQERQTYFHPAVTAAPPTLWVPRDAGGVSRRECQVTSQVIPMSDEGAHLDEKNKIVWDREGAGEVPVAVEKVYW